MKLILGKKKVAYDNCTHSYSSNYNQLIYQLLYSRRQTAEFFPFKKKICQMKAGQNPVEILQFPDIYTSLDHFEGMTAKFVGWVIVC